MRHFILADLAAIASQTPALTPQQEAIRPFGPICGEAPIFADAREHKLIMPPSMIRLSPEAQGPPGRPSGPASGASRASIRLHQTDALDY